MSWTPIDKWDQVKRRKPTTRADITGQRFCRLVAVRPVASDARGNVIWLTKCDCGGETRSSVNNLRKGQRGCIQCRHPAGLAKTRGAR